MAADAPPPVASASSSIALGAPRAAALALLSAVLYVLAFPGFGAWPLGFVAMVPLLLALEGQPPRRALWIGWLSGTALAALGFYWLLGLLVRYGGFPLPLCVLFLLILSAYQGARMALFAWVAARIRANGWPIAWGVPIAFAAAEATFPLLFPWQFGAVLSSFPLLIQTADIGGPILVSTTLLMANIACALSLRSVARRRWEQPRWIAAGAVVVVVAAGYGVLRMRQAQLTVQSAPKVRVGLVQGNVPMDIQGDDAYADAHLRHLRLSRRLIDDSVDLVIWPESALLYPVPIQDMDRFVGEAMTRRMGVAALFGAVLYEPGSDHMVQHNSALMADRTGRVTGRYDKHHLLAFGEYIPFGERFPWLYKLSPASGRFVPGQSFAPVEYEGHRISVLICYEDILPRFVNESVRSGDPELLVDITNDAWFGETLEPEMHLALAQFRAVEHRRYLVRAANTGVSAIIGPTGQVLARTKSFEPEVLAGIVGWIRRTTLYELWGDAPWYIISMIAALGALMRRPRRLRAAR